MTRKSLKMRTVLLGALRSLPGDERGTEMMEQVALLGFVILPLMAVLIAFRKKVTTLFQAAWTDLGI